MIKLNKEYLVPIMLKSIKREPRYVLVFFTEVDFKIKVLINFVH